MRELFQQLSDDELNKRIVDAVASRTKVEEELASRQGWLDMAQDELRERQNKVQRQRVDDCQEHYYIPTNAKWQSVSQVRCQFCGDVRN